jgi:hypothetical protein
LRALSARPDKVKLFYHGLDFAHLPPPAHLSGRGSDGTGAADPVGHPVAIGTTAMVEK